MKNQKKTNFQTNFKEELKQQMKDIKLVKYGVIVLTVSGGLIGLGYTFKILNFTVFNYLKLKNTLKQ